MKRCNVAIRCRAFPLIGAFPLLFSTVDAQPLPFLPKASVRIYGRRSATAMMALGKARGVMVSDVRYRMRVRYPYPKGWLARGVG
jgi:hypothetical protein